MLSATLGALLPAVDDAGEDSFQPFGLEKAIPDMTGDEVVQFVHRNRAALAAGLALPCLGRAGVIAVCRACATSASAERHRAPALGAEANAGKQDGAAGYSGRRHQRIARLQTCLHSVEYLAFDQWRHRHD